MHLMYYNQHCPDKSDDEIKIELREKQQPCLLRQKR